MGAVSFYLLKPCRGKAAFEAVPKDGCRLDMDKGANLLRAHGYDVTDAKVMLVAAKGGLKVSIYPSGKLIIQTGSEEMAFDAANGIYAVFGLGEAI